MALANVLPRLLYHGYEATEGFTGFANEGTFLIFGVILFPIYVMIVAWFVGMPRNTRTGLLGVTYLVGIATTMWVSMLVLTVLIGIVFYGSMPEPFSPY